jgi:hypothetical protein
MKKRNLIFTSVLVSALLLCSCGNSDSDNVTNETSTAYENGESETETIGGGQEKTEVETNDVSVAQGDIPDFDGTWYDTVSTRCDMEIYNQNDEYYVITIDWGSSAWDNTHWEFTGYYEPEQGGIVYQNGYCYDQYYPDDGGDMQQTEVYSNGEGIIYMMDGNLYWNDQIENMGVDCVFVRYETGMEEDNGESWNLGEFSEDWYKSAPNFADTDGNTLEIIYLDDGELEFAINGETMYYGMANEHTDYGDGIYIYSLNDANGNEATMLYYPKDTIQIDSMVFTAVQ